MHDVDGDGIADLVYTQGRGRNERSPLIIEWGQDEDRICTFTDDYTLIPEAGSPFAIGDFKSNDGVLDIATIKGTQVQIMKGTGEHQFVRSASYAFEGQLTCARAANLDGDGKVDFVVGSRSRSLQFRFSDGTTETIRMRDEPCELRIADVDNDGLDDVLVAGHGRRGGLHLIKVDATHQIAEPVVIETPWRLLSFEVADVNDDGYQDIVTYERGVPIGDEGWISVLLGDGKGSFAAASAHSVPKLNSLNDYDAPVMVLARLEGGDDPMDIVFTGGEPSTITVLQGVGDGTFHSRRDYRSLLNTYSITGVDWTGDGRIECLGVLGDKSMAMYEFVNRGKLYAPESIDRAYEDPNWGTEIFALHDVVGDGLLDSIAIDADGGRLVICEGTAQGVFKNLPAFTTTVPKLSNDGTQGPQAIAVGDFDGDGNRRDIAIAHWDGNDAGVLLLISKGDGTYNNLGSTFVDAVMGTWGDVYSLAVCDVDGRAGDDLIFGCRQVEHWNGTLAVLTADGGDGFDVHRIERTGENGRVEEWGVHAVVVGDFDGNGSDEFVTLEGGARYFYLYDWDRTAACTRTLAVAETGFMDMAPVWLGDRTGLVLANGRSRDGAAVAMFKMQGEGQWDTGAWQVSAESLHGFDVKRPIVGDLTGNSCDDLIVCGGNDQPVVMVFEGDERGSFNKKPSVHPTNRSKDGPAGIWQDFAGIAVDDTLTDEQAALIFAFEGGYEVFLNTGRVFADRTPRVFISNAAVAEDAGPAEFWVSLDIASKGPVDVKWESVEAELHSHFRELRATPEADFSGGGVVTLTPENPVQRIKVDIRNDREEEVDERFLVKLTEITGSPAVWGNEVGFGLILDDGDSGDVTTVSFTPDARYEIEEGNTGQRELRLALTITEPLDEEIKVYWSTADSRAKAIDGDYQHVEKECLTIEANKTSAEIVVYVNGDTVDETFEEFWVRLDSVSANAVLGNIKQARCSILDDDGDAPSGGRGRSRRGDRGSGGRSGGG